VTSETGLRRFVRPAAGSPASGGPVSGSPPSGSPASGSSGPAVAPPSAAAAAAAAPAPAPAAAAPAPPMPVLPGTRSSQRDSALAGRPAEAPEKCELCATEVPAEHGHIADLEASSLLCACRACYLLFTRPNAGRMKYRAVPDRYLTDSRRVMAPVEWDQLDIPVGLAFFLRTDREDGGLAGFYPSPAGVTECRLDLQQWERLVADYPLLGAAEPDLEAALISRSDDGVEYFVVPIDACYELAGRMRLHWRGFDGGTEARQSIADFLAMVRSRARDFSQEG
jgi:hypothetical protein